MGPDSHRSEVSETDRRHFVAGTSVGGFCLALGKVSLLQRASCHHVAKRRNTAALQNVAAIPSAIFAGVLECGGAPPLWDRVARGLA